MDEADADNHLTDLRIARRGGGLRGLVATRNLIVVAYLRRFRVGDAAKAAGCSRRYVRYVLGRPNTKLVLKREARKLFEKANHDAQDTLRAFVEWLDADLADAYDGNGKVKNIHDIPPHLRRWIKEYDKEKGVVKLMDKSTPATALGKYHRIVTDTVEIKGGSALETMLNSMSAEQRPPGMERRGVRIWEGETDAVLEPQRALPEPTP